MPPTRRRRKASAAAPKAAAMPSTKPKRARRQAAPVKLSEAPPPGRDAPAYLNVLPDELLLLILDCLWAAFWNPAFRALQFRDVCLTNRRLNRLGNNFLYEEFDATSWAHPTKFLRTIIANRDLASRVKKLSWTFEMLDHNPNAKDTFEPSSAEQRLLRESLKDLQIKDRGELVRQYCSGEQAHLFNLALLHTPNLRELDVDDVTAEYRSIPRIHYQTKGFMGLINNAVRPTSVGLSPTYPHLRVLRLSMGDMWLEDMLPVLRIPSLRQLKLLGLDGVKGLPDHSALVSLKDTSAVTELSILDSFLDSHTLAHIISAPRKLDTFKFVYSSRPYSLPPPKISYDVLGKALQKHKTSLNHLLLDDVSNRTLHAMTDYGRGHLGSFHDFENLEFFSVPIEALDVVSDPGAYLAKAFGDTQDPSTVSNLFVPLGQKLPKCVLYLGFTIFEDEEISKVCSESLLVLHRSHREHVPFLQVLEVKAHQSVYLRHCDFSAPQAQFLRDRISFPITQSGIDEDDLIYSSDEDDAMLYDSLDGFDDWAHTALSLDDLLSYPGYADSLYDEGDNIGYDGPNAEEIINTMAALMETGQMHAGHLNALHQHYQHHHH